MAVRLAKWGVEQWRERDARLKGDRSRWAGRVRSWHAARRSAMGKPADRLKIEVVKTKCVVRSTQGSAVQACRLDKDSGRQRVKLWTGKEEDAAAREFEVAELRRAIYNCVLNQPQTRCCSAAPKRSSRVRWGCIGRFPVPRLGQGYSGASGTF